MKKILQKIQNISNLVQLAGNTIIIVLLQIQFSSPTNQNNDKQLLIFLLKCMELSQLSDVFFTILGMSGGSALIALCQVASRIIIAIFIIKPDSDHTTLLQVAYAWAFSESIRYAYYLFKNSCFNIFGHLRYNSFFILYPIGVSGEIMLLVQYFSKLFPEQILYIKISIGLMYIPFPYLYYYMIIQRSKYYQKLKKN